VGKGERAIGRGIGDRRCPSRVGQVGRHLEGAVDAGCGARNPSPVAGSAAGIRWPRADGGFIGYLRNKAVKLCARTRALKFLLAGDLEHIAWTVSTGN
jgi:hypothetical protein